MSRSQPNNNAPNPSTRWFEWSGSEGQLKYYDKAEKRNILAEKEFSFILLDQTATVKGWHDASESAIFSNEVKDTRASTLVVKAFKGGILAEGFYTKIRDKIAALGGHFTTNLYIAYTNDEAELAIGSLQFKGAALGVWMEFSKNNRADLYEKTIEIAGYNEGKKGKVVFRTPKFFIKSIDEEDDRRAKELDAELQEYLKAYFARTRVEQAAPPAETTDFDAANNELAFTPQDDDETPF